MEKQPIERKYDPSKQLKIQGTESVSKDITKVLKRREYQKKYKEKLKERMANGDEKAKSIIERNNMYLKSMTEKKMNVKLQKVEQKVEPPIVEPPKVEPSVVEPPKVEPPKVEPPKVEPPKEIPKVVEAPIEFVKKEKYKKLKQRVNQLEEDLFTRVPKPKYRSAVYDSLFGKH